MGRRRAAGGVQQAASWPQEVATPAPERGRGEARGDGPATHDAEAQDGNESKLVHKLQSTRGWFHPPYIRLFEIRAASSRLWRTSESESPSRSSVRKRTWSYPRLPHSLRTPSRNSSIAFR